MRTIRLVVKLLKTYIWHVGEGRLSIIIDLNNHDKNNFIMKIENKWAYEITILQCLKRFRPPLKWNNLGLCPLVILYTYRRRCLGAVACRPFVQVLPQVPTASHCHSGANSRTCHLSVHCCRDEPKRGHEEWQIPHSAILYFQSVIITR